jgi:hypothetical protein
LSILNWFQKPPKRDAPEGAAAIAARIRDALAEQADAEGRVAELRTRRDRDLLLLTDEAVNQIDTQLAAEGLRLERLELAVARLRQMQRAAEAREDNAAASSAARDYCRALLGFAAALDTAAAARSACLAMRDKHGRHLAAAPIPPDRCDAEAIARLRDAAAAFAPEAATPPAGIKMRLAVPHDDAQPGDAIEMDDHAAAHAVVQGVAALVSEADVTRLHPALIEPHRQRNAPLPTPDAEGNVQIIALNVIASPRLLPGARATLPAHDAERLVRSGAARFAATAILAAAE